MLKAECKPGDRVTVWQGNVDGEDVFATGIVADRWDGSVGVVLDWSDGSVWRTTPGRVSIDRSA